jgi:D-arabinose 1-dehydrogenase-like Zn-dependent alcohol dehydrogenase
MLLMLAEEKRSIVIYGVFRELSFLLSFRRPGPSELLVKVISCGICGSDIVEWYRLPRAPLVQGHELGAEVVEVGA